MEESGASPDYLHFEEDELSQWLSKFWFAAHTGNSTNEHYTVNSLRSFKYAINQKLKRHGHSFDITKNPFFKDCMDAFNDACRNLKEKGKGCVKNYEKITDEGI